MVAEKCVLNRMLARLAVTSSVCIYQLIIISSAGGPADAGAGVVREFEHLADGQVGWVVDQVAVKVEDFAGAMGVSEHVAGD